MTYNFATLTHTLSADFIVTAKLLSRKTTLDNVAFLMQARYNKAHDDRKVTITEMDVERALSVHDNKALFGDEASIVAIWLRTELPTMVAPTCEATLAKFVTWLRETNRVKRFRHIEPTEFRGLFAAVYNALEARFTNAFFA